MQRTIGESEKDLKWVSDKIKKHGGILLNKQIRDLTNINGLLHHVTMEENTIAQILAICA